MLQYIFLLMSDDLWQMSELILLCADHICPNTFQSLFHALPVLADSDGFYTLLSNSFITQQS